MKFKNPDVEVDLSSLNLPNLNLPGWVNWLAQDADGQWWGYEVEPHQHHKGWYENELGRNMNTNTLTASDNWKNSLCRWTKNH